MTEIELFLNPEGEWLNRIALVDEPAIEADFMAFAKEHLMFSADEERRIITGPVMIPDKRMYRNWEGGVMVYFSAETIREAAYRWLLENKNHEFNLQHQDSIASISVIESWIVEDPEKDKSAYLGFTDIPKGTWFISCKIMDESVWQAIKSGEFNGFSVEGMFAYIQPDPIRQAEEFLKTIE